MSAASSANHPTTMTTTTQAADGELQITDEALAMLEQWPDKQRLHQSLARNLHMKCLCLTISVALFVFFSTWCGLYSVILYKSTPLVVVSSLVLPDNFDDSSSEVEYSCHKYIAIPIVGAVLCYISYLIECFSCDTRYTIAKRVQLDTLMQRIEQMRTAMPVVWWRAICYHYAPHSRQIIRYRGGGDSFPATQQYYERVNTHAAGTTFDYSHCGLQDVSKIIEGMDKHGAVKVRISKGFAFANRKAAHEFEQQRASFFQSHEARDEFMEMREGLDLFENDFVDYVLTYKSKRGPPWYIYSTLFWIASFFLLSWPLRVLIEYRTAFLDFSIIKLFGVNYFVPGEVSPRASVACVTATTTPTTAATTPGTVVGGDEDDMYNGTSAAVRRLSELHLAHLALSTGRLRAAAAAAAAAQPTIAEDDDDELAPEDEKAAQEKRKEKCRRSLLLTPPPPPNNTATMTISAAAAPTTISRADELLMLQRYHFSHSYNESGDKLPASSGGGGGGGQWPGGGRHHRSATPSPVNDFMEDSAGGGDGDGERGGSLKRHIEKPMRYTANRLGLRWPTSPPSNNNNVNNNDNQFTSDNNLNAFMSEREQQIAQVSAARWRQGVVARGTLIRRDERQQQHASSTVQSDEENNFRQRVAAEAGGEHDDIRLARQNSNSSGGKKHTKHHHNKQHRPRSVRKPPPPLFTAALASSKPLVLPRVQTERLLRSPTIKATPPNIAAPQTPTVPMGHTLVVPVQQEYVPQQSTEAIIVAGSGCFVSAADMQQQHLQHVTPRRRSNFTLPLNADNNNNMNMSAANNSYSNFLSPQDNNADMQPFFAIRRPSRTQETTI